MKKIVIQVGDILEEKKPQYEGAKLKKIRILNIRNKWHPVKGKFELRADYEVVPGQEFYTRDGVCRDGMLGSALMKNIVTEFKHVEK